MICVILVKQHRDGNRLLLFKLNNRILVLLLIGMIVVFQRVPHQLNQKHLKFTIILGTRKITLQLMRICSRRLQKLGAISHR